MVISGKTWMAILCTPSPNSHRYRMEVPLVLHNTSFFFQIFDIVLRLVDSMSNSFSYSCCRLNIAHYLYKTSFDRIVFINQNNTFHKHNARLLLVWEIPFYKKNNQRHTAHTLTTDI